MAAAFASSIGEGDPGPGEGEKGEMGSNSGVGRAIACN